MYKKTMTYLDYNDVEVTEDFYFNMSEAELTKMEIETKGGMEALLDKIIKTKDVYEMMKLFEKLIELSYGEKDPDGRHFNKSPEILARFKSTPAYSDMYMELASDDKAAADFVNGIIPKRLLEQAQEISSANPALTAVTSPQD